MSGTIFNPKFEIPMDHFHKTTNSGGTTAKIYAFSQRKMAFVMQNFHI